MCFLKAKYIRYYHYAYIVSVWNSKVYEILTFLTHGDPFDSIFDCYYSYAYFL